jgi:hypothetical protein
MSSSRLQHRVAALLPECVPAALLGAVAVFGCGPNHTETAPSCRADASTVHFSSRMAAVTPAMSAEQIYAFTGDAPPELVRFDRRSGTMETLLELPAESAPVAVGLDENRIVYLDRGRRAVYSLALPLASRPEEATLVSNVELSLDSRVAHNDTAWFWSTEANADTAGAIMTSGAGVESATTLLEARDERVIALAADAQKVVALLERDGKRRIAQVPLDAAAATTLAELDCDALWLDGDVFCRVDEALYSVPSSGGAPVKRTEVSHLGDSTVSSGYWYLALMSLGDPERGSLARLPLRGGNTELLSCDRPLPTRLAADSAGLAWLSSNSSTELSLDGLLF